MADQAIYAPFRVLDASGAPVSGALAYFYATGSDTLLTIYEDDDEITLAENPVEADASGALPQRYFTGEARVVVKTPAGVTLYTFNPVPRSVSSTSSASAVPFANAANIPALNVQAAIELVDTNARARDTAAAAALGGLATQNILDENDFATNSATRPPSQKSTKAYIANTAALNDASQRWAIVSRTPGTAYQNATSRTIQVVISGSNGAGNSLLNVSLDGSTWLDIGNVGANSRHYTVTADIPPGQFYRVPSGCTIAVAAERSIP